MPPESVYNRTPEGTSCTSWAVCTELGLWEIQLQESARERANIALNLGAGVGCGQGPTSHLLAASLSHSGVTERDEERGLG